MNPLSKENLKQLAMRLDGEHKGLEQWFRDLAQRAESGEMCECDALWSDFTQQIENHMAFEEREVFPRYAQRDAEAAAIVEGLRAEHAAVRTQLDIIGVDLQLHLSNSEVIDTLIAKLRDHARRERETLYPWLATQKEKPSATAHPSAAH